MVANPDKNSNKKQIVEESLKTKKAREKLKKKLQSMDEKFTKEALNKKSIEIHRWISRHADRRVILREKSISLFDENQNAAEVSQRISKLVEKIQYGNLPE
jgi:hypothetical protein